jgi:hypothetical protein
MEIKPEKGLKVLVNAQREAVFGDEGVSIQGVKFADGNNSGTMTGHVLAGFVEVEMPELDGKKHWYPIADLRGVHGEGIVEEEIPIEIPEDDAESEEEPS